MKRAQIALVLILIIVSFHVKAQRETLNGLIEKLQWHQQATLQEKIFVHLDRTFFVGGETMWFKVYVTDGYLHQLMSMSKVVYIDMLDRNNQSVLQTKVSIENGVGNGSITIPASLDSDNYTVRAYTSWMKNFSADFFFHQAISIVNVFQRFEEKGKTDETKLDAQFFPEGGSLIEGMRSKVAFRVVDVTGKGVSFKGALISSSGDTVLSFSPLKFGIGHFTFTPKAESYQAVIKENNGKTTLVKLPKPQTTGYSMMVTDTTQNRIKVTVRGNDPQGTTLIYLVGHTRQLIKLAIAQNLINGKISFVIDKKELGDGITHLTVFSQSLQPVCERLLFKRPTDKINVLMNSDKPVYNTRDKISLQLTINNEQTQFANSSLSVFKNDVLQQLKPTDIQSYLWLTSELKGSIESPEYYFSDDVSVNEAMDNLMLTHGWSKFKWEDVFRTKGKTHLYLPEYRGHIITAKIVDTNSSKPVQGIPAYLSAPDKKTKPYMSYSDGNGVAIFETSNLTGAKKVIAQTGAYQTSTRIEINSPFSSENPTITIPYLKLSADVKGLLTQRSISMQAEDIYYRGRVKNAASQVDSAAFFGDPSEHYNLDDYTRFPVMEEVMREYVKGVRLRKKDNQFIFKVLNAPRNLVFENEPLVLLDGVPVFNTDKIMTIDPLKIKYIDVVTKQYYYGKFIFDGIVSYQTYQHDLGGFQFDAGAVVIDYEGLQTKKEFFAPRYETAADRQSRLPDERNLLLWKPDLTIGNKSQVIEFYSSDQTGSYQAIIQGISQHGQPVFQTYTFEVKSLKQ